MYEDKNKILCNHRIRSMLYSQKMHELLRTSNQKTKIIINNNVIPKVETSVKCLNKRMYI